MEFLNSNWENIYTRFLLWAILILVIFRLLGFGIHVLIRDEKLKLKINRLLPPIELSVWSMFIVWFMFIFAEVRSLFSLVLLAILLTIIYFLFRFWLSDLIAGVIFKTKRIYHKGDFIQIGNHHSGQIKKLGNNCIEIETQDGKTIYYPYTKILNKVSLKSESTERISGYTIDLKVRSSENINDITNKIRKYILALPWYATQNPPIIKLIEQDQDLIVFKITFYPTDKSFAIKIKQMIIGKFEKA
jgi:small-conductance mechanosensitive channel